MIEIGGFFIVGSVIRKSELINTLKNNTSFVFITIVILGLLLMALTVWISTTPNPFFSRISQRTLLLLAPLNLVMLINLCQLVFFL